MGILYRKAAAEAGGPDEGEYELVSPEFCDACGHEILDEHEDYCPFCGETLKKVKKPVKRKTGGGGTALLFFIIVIVIWLLVRR